MLNDIIQAYKTDQISFEFPVEVKKQEKILEEQLTEAVTKLDVDVKMKSTSPKLKLRQSNDIGSDDDIDDDVREKESDVSESTVLYHNVSNTAYTKEIETSDLDVNKKDFFSSDSDCSNSSSTYENKLPKKKKRKKKDVVLEERKSNEKEEKEKLKKKPDSEEKELEKLLSMTELNLVSRAYTSDSEGERNGQEKRKEKKSLKSKQEEMSLLDYLEPEGCEGPGNFDLEEKKKEEEEEKESFFSLVNNQIKETFLLSSDESYRSSGESDNEMKKEIFEKKKSKNGKKTKEKLLIKKEKKDELMEFRIPNLSWKEKETSEKETSGVELTEKDPTNEEDGNNTSSDVSDDSVKCVQHVKKKKRVPIDDSKRDTDSESEIQQLFYKTDSSPTKGRKNIKKILKKECLQVETKQALKMEEDRKKRVSERQKLFEAFFPNSDADSKLILDFDPQTKKELLVVDEQLSQMLKPHQKDGVRFMWNCCFESLKRLEEDSGSGCVLAHCMGLGKTLQVITLVHTILTHNTGVHTVLIICPLNTIRNWTNEFKMWQKDCQNKIKPLDLIPCRNKHERLMKVKLWLNVGGVLVISYEMFRSLIKKYPENSIFFQGFLNPGPDLVVCDEGHVLKNSNSEISKCIFQIKTLRRIILTGTPLQNNLVEYYCMVQFVKPNILGTMKEFKNRFVHPINNGQFEDSTRLDVLLMKRRSHVLHTMLDGFIQRFGYYVLTPFLPEKQEYVISIALTETQENIYRLFIEPCKLENRELLKDFHWLQKVWTHPRCMMVHSVTPSTNEEPKNEWHKFVREEEYCDLRSSGKLFLLFNILKRSKEIGDKVLVFSQFLFNLDLIEYFLRNANRDYFSGKETEFAESWELGLDYYRLDGSTSSDNRDNFCQKFNNVHDKRFRLFLISTKAGGLGISLVAANRVILFDASWNPTHDVQSIFRIYRFGQKKPCFIYRFLAAATMEEKIYKRQVTKLSLAHRILDEHQIERHYTMDNLQELYKYDPIPKTEWKVPKIPKDNLFAEILANNRDIIVGYHEHDSLLENKEEEELTEEDRRAAWEDYEKEKLTLEHPLPAFNGTLVPLPVMRRINYEGLKVVQEYKYGMVAPSVTQVVNNVQNENRFCRIVDVRTLQGEENVYTRMERERILELGRFLNLKRLEGESHERFCMRINEIFKIFSRRTPFQ